MVNGAKTAIKITKGMARKTDVTLSMIQQTTLFSITPSGPINTKRRPKTRPTPPPITKGTIAKEKSGKYGWSWDYIFIPDGYEIPMGNYPDEERFAMWNNDGLKELAKYLKQKN